MMGIRQLIRRANFRIISPYGFDEIGRIYLSTFRPLPNIRRPIARVLAPTLEDRLVEGFVYVGMCSVVQFRRRYADSAIVRSIYLGVSALHKLLVGV